jgi:threonine synthase
VTRKLIEQGRIPRDEDIVLCVTGNGLKTQDAVTDLLQRPQIIRPALEEFESIYEADQAGVEKSEPVLVGA